MFGSYALNFSGYSELYNLFLPLLSLSILECSDGPGVSSKVTYVRKYNIIMENNKNTLKCYLGNHILLLFLYKHITQ